MKLHSLFLMLISHDFSISSLAEYYRFTIYTILITMFLFLHFFFSCEFQVPPPEIYIYIFFVSFTGMDHITVQQQVTVLNKS